MSLSAVLSSVLHGQSNFCCLCFENVGEDALHIDGDIFIDDDHSETMSLIVDTIFASEVETVSAFGIFCEKCKKFLLKYYKFISMCKENSEKLFSAIASLQESFENTIKDADSYKGLFVSLDVNNFTSQQFYDIKKLPRQTKMIHERFSTLLNANKTKQEKMCNYKNHDFEKYNIPTIPTKSMVNENFLNYSCKVCHESFIEEKYLRLHYFRKHYPKLFKCSYCPLRFITEELLIAHEVVHKPGVCSQCGKHFPTGDQLQKHELRHNIKVICPECGRIYRSKEAFRKHIADRICQQKSKKNSHEGIYQCDICKKRYWIKPYLAKHILYEHGNATGYKCKFCNKQFYTPSRLETHLVKHTREKNFMCSICGGKFVTKSSLLYHTRLHTGERPYKCDFCDSAFLSASRRLDHMRKHHLPPTLKCDMCNMMFKGTGSLLKHKKRHMNPHSRLNIAPRFLPSAEIEVECVESKID